jgi:GntR family transcriptional regulator
MNLKGLSIDKNIPVPLYYQLKQILLEQMKHAEVGALIPTETELCSIFNISRPTVRQAINELVTEGFLYRMKGKGTFISRPKISQDFMMILESFNDEMKEKGLTPTTKVLQFKIEKASENVAEKLQLDEGSDVVLLKRLRSANKEPIVLVDTYLPNSMVQNILSKDLTNESLYKIIERDYGYVIDKAIRTIEPVIAGEYETKLLGVKKGVPLQYIETVAYLDNRTPIEYSIAKYRGDRSTFSFELTKKKI